MNFYGLFLKLVAVAHLDLLSLIYAAFAPAVHTASIRRYLQYAAFIYINRNHYANARYRVDKDHVMRYEKGATHGRPIRLFTQHRIDVVRLNFRTFLRG